MIKCPVCGKYEFARSNDFDVCPVCEWENDGVQTNDTTYWGGANDLCLNDYREKWERENLREPFDDYSTNDSRIIVEPSPTNRGTVGESSSSLREPFVPNRTE